LYKAAGLSRQLEEAWIKIFRETREVPISRWRRRMVRRIADGHDRAKGRELARLRKASGLSQEQLATLLGISPKRNRWLWLDQTTVLEDTPSCASNASTMQRSIKSPYRTS
jgi:hypothetical protein